MPQASDLTTLQAVKLWAFGDGNAAAWPQAGAALTALDNQLGVLITAASRAVLSKLQRPNISYRTVNEMRDGTSTPWLLLREWPVSSIGSLSIGAYTVPLRPALTGGPAAIASSPYGPYGYVLEPWDGNPPGKPQKLSVDGSYYCSGNFNISITYQAGYAVLSEAQTVLAAGAAPLPTVPYVIPAQPWGRWAGDVSVTYASTGLALAKVATNPAQGQYVAPSIPASLSTPAFPQFFYQFNTADVGQNILVSYSAVPYELDQAVSKWIGEWTSYRTRRGEKSKSLPQGGGTQTFDLSAMPADVQMMINPYRKAIPL